MRYPAFFDEAPRLVVLDPLSAFLGATEDGVIEYRYLDAVKLAGHSCPTVAGAYLMTVKALADLYGRELPVRGEIDVLLAGRPNEGVTGVIAAIASLLTGAAGEGGFKGIAGGFDRRDRVTFGLDLSCSIAFRRRDTGATVGATLNAGVVPASSEMRLLLEKVLCGEASDADEAVFRQQWQGRVQRMLIEHADDPALISVHPVDLLPC